MLTIPNIVPLLLVESENKWFVVETPSFSLRLVFYGYAVDIWWMVMDNWWSDCVLGGAKEGAAPAGARVVGLQLDISLLSYMSYLPGGAAFSTTCFWPQMLNLSLGKGIYFKMSSISTVLIPSWSFTLAFCRWDISSASESRMQLWHC